MPLSSTSKQPDGSLDGGALGRFYRGHFGKIFLAAAIACLIAIITNYGLCFQDPEMVVGYVPTALKNGLHFSVRDFVTALDAWNLDGDGRPRFISYFSYILAVKTRLALWDFLPPHPSFSPIWLFTLIVGPLMLFRFLRVTLNDQAASQVGLGSYLLSPALLGATTMFFHPAKPLTDVVIIAILWLTASIDRSINEGLRAFQSVLDIPTLKLIGLLSLLIFGPFVDETAAFAYLIPLVWCSYLFWPPNLSWSSARRSAINLGLLAVPALTVMAIMGLLKWLGPVVVDGRQFDMLAYLSRYWHSQRLGVSHILWQGYNLFSAAMLPGSYSEVPAPVRWHDINNNSVELSWVGIILCGTVIALTAIVVRRNKLYWNIYRKLAILLVCFVLFQSAVLVFHPLLIVAPGYYYGSIFSILFAAITAVVFLDFWRRPNVFCAYAAGVLVVYLGVVSVINFLAINASWIRHDNFKMVYRMAALPFYGKMGNWAPLERLKSDNPIFPTWQPFYISEPKTSPDASAFGDAMAIWRNWKRGEPDLLGGRDVHVRDLWLLRELTIKNQLSK